MFPHFFLREFWGSGKGNIGFSGKMCDGVRLFRGVMSRLTGMDVGVHTRASMLNVFLRNS